VALPLAALLRAVALLAATLRAAVVTLIARVAPAVVTTIFAAFASRDGFAIIVARATVVTASAIVFAGAAVFVTRATIFVAGITVVAGSTVGAVAAGLVIVAAGFAFALRFTVIVAGAAIIVAGAAIIVAGAAIIVARFVATPGIIFARNVIAGTFVTTRGGIIAAAVVLVFVGFGMGRAETVIAREGAALGFFLGIWVIRASGALVGAAILGWRAGAIVATTLRTLRAAATLRGAVVVIISTATTATTTATTTSAPTTLATLRAVTAIGIVTATTLRRTVTLRGRTVALRTLLFATFAGSATLRIFAGPRQGLGSGVKLIILFVFFVKFLVDRKRSIGRAGADGSGNRFRFLREILTRRELDVAGGEAGELGGAKQARRFGIRDGADSERRDDIGRAGAEELLDGVGHKFGVDGALGVERHQGLGRCFLIRAGVEGRGLDAIGAEFFEQGFGEVVETAFDCCGHGAAEGRAVPIPREDEEVALLFAQPREGDAGEGDGREETDVHALNERGDGGIEERCGRLARSVNDVVYVPIARHDVFGDLG